MAGQALKVGEEQEVVSDRGTWVEPELATEYEAEAATCLLWMAYGVDTVHVD